MAELDELFIRVAAGQAQESFPHTAGHSSGAYVSPRGDHHSPMARDDIWRAIDLDAWPVDLCTSTRSVR